MAATDKARTCQTCGLFSMMKCKLLENYTDQHRCKGSLLHCKWFVINLLDFEYF